MFFLANPSDARIHQLLDDRADAPFTYADVGATRQRLRAAPPGYHLDSYKTKLGRGEVVFQRACEVLSELGNYPPSFTRVVRQPGVMRKDLMFATVASHVVFTSVHPCRVIYVIDDYKPRRFGFGFGTLSGHEESGEERFLITLDETDGTVRYEVQAFSRPHGLLTRLGAPVARAYQRRFQRETLQTMRDACEQT